MPLKTSVLSRAFLQSPINSIFYSEKSEIPSKKQVENALPERLDFLL